MDIDVPANYRLILLPWLLTTLYGTLVLSLMAFFHRHNIAKTLQIPSQQDAEKYVRAILLQGLITVVLYFQAALINPKNSPINPICSRLYSETNQHQRPFFPALPSLH